jgi:hypothetical protein
MKFLEEPPPGLVANSAMTPEQLDTAALFVDELIKLGVLERPVEPLANSFPLFLVPKALTGQWRCIANGKSGGQNLVCTSDPVHLGTPDDILPYLYTGGGVGCAGHLKVFPHVPNCPKRVQVYGPGPPEDRQRVVLCHLPNGHPELPQGFGSVWQRISPIDLRRMSPLSWHTLTQ